jgi:formylglycine-generating enzyme required for sulfatase activity
LDYTHSRKITHLDLKPLNILRQNDGTIKVIDFGLSKQYDAEGTVESSSVDAAGITEGYSPLELYDRGSMEKFSPETDIYSLGATLYFMLTGSTPPSAPQLIRRFPIPDSVSPRMATVIRQAMQPDKENRPQSIAAFVALLNGGVPDEETKDLQQEKTKKLPDKEKEPDVIVVVDPPPPPAPASSSDKRSLIWTGIIVAVLVFVLGIILYPFDSSPVDKGDDAGDTVIVRVDTPVSIPPVAPKPTSTPVVEPAAPTTQRIIGRIYSSADNAGITGVTVSVKGTTLRTRTNNDGRFSLDEVPLTAQRISLSKSGYTTQEVAIESNMLVEMKPVVKSQPVVAETPQSGGNNPRQFLEPEMVFVQGGTFTMGSPESEPERSSGEVQHQVTLSSFYIGKYEVTQGQWKAVMGSNPSYFKDKGDNYPVERVSWNDVQEFLWKLNAATGKRYRLPTEAEWEYACRAGSTTPFNTGNNLTTSQANYDGNYPYNGNAKGTYLQRTQPVGSYSPNAWGIYDMHGNVWEWCSDWYGDYSTSAQTNPPGPSSGSLRVLRGGSWNYDAESCRSALRYGSFPFYPDYDSYGGGFRVVAPL